MTLEQVIELESIHKSMEDKALKLSVSDCSPTFQNGVDLIDIFECPGCRGSAFTSIGIVDTLDSNLNLSVTVRRCESCLHWHTSPMPRSELLNHLYSCSHPAVIGANWDIKTKHSNLLGGLASDDHWIVSRLNCMKAGSFLEVGSGDGRVLRKMRSLGWNSWGVEPGSYGEGSQVVSNYSDLPIDNKFDVIVFQDVLEHVSNPVDEISLYVQFMAQDCMLFMTVPWSESKRARLLQGDWDMVKPLGHLHYFSKYSTKLILDKNDFDVIEMFPVNIYPYRGRSIILALISILVGYLRPSRWNTLRNRAKHLISLLKIFPERPLGDQLYVVGKKRRIPDRAI
jgi:hypothetical protein